MNRFRYLVLLGAASGAMALLTGASQAQQSPLTFTICQGPTGCGTTSNSSYKGVGFDSTLVGISVAGVAQEAGVTSGPMMGVNDAYDNFGGIYGAASRTGSIITGYTTAFNGLDAWRQTESYVAVPDLPANSIRWYDSFTNNTGSTITANLAFGGNLGSDSATKILASGAGYVVTGQGDTTAGASDPVIAHIYGNNDYALNVATPIFVNGNDQTYVIYPVTVAPGQTVSLMNVNLLFGADGRLTDPNGTIYAQDAALAVQNAERFINDPIFAGLTAAQVQTLLNWNVAIDGTLPAAGAATTANQFAQQVFGHVMDARSLANPQQFASTGHGPSELMGYVPIAGGVQSSATNAIADSVAIGQATSGRRSDLYVFGEYAGGRQGFSSGTLDYNGYTVGAGAEHMFTPDLLGGVMVGLGHGTGVINTVYNSLTNNQFSVTPYASWRAPTATVLDLSMSVSSLGSSYERVAGASLAHANVTGSGIAAQAKVSQPLTMGEIMVTPYAKLSVSRSNIDGYEETGAGSANLAIPSYSITTLDAQAGVTLSRAWLLDQGRAVRVYGGLGIGKGLLGDTSIETRYTSSATTFTTPVEVNDDLAARLDLGVSFEINEHFSASASYNGALSQNAQQHLVGASLTGHF